MHICIANSSIYFIALGEDQQIVSGQDGLISLALLVLWSYSDVKFNGFSRTADSEAHVVHISHVIIAYTLESLSSLT